MNISHRQYCKASDDFINEMKSNRIRSADLAVLVKAVEAIGCRLVLSTLQPDQETADGVMSWIAVVKQGSFV